MKLLLVFALLALVCMARTAPTTPKGRELIIPSYDDKDEESVNQDEHEDEGHEEASTTTRRTSITFPTRDRILIPSRRPSLPPMTKSSTTSTRRSVIVFPPGSNIDDGDKLYNGDYEYFQHLRRQIRQLMEQMKRIIQSITGLNLGVTMRNQ